MGLETTYNLDHAKFITRFAAIKMTTELTIKKWQKALSNPADAEQLLAGFLLNGIIPIHQMSDNQLESKLKSLTNEIYLVIKESF